MSLDLLYWCQQRYRDRYRRLRVLPAPDGEHALWLDDGRVRAVIGARPPPDGFGGLQLALAREAGEPRWYVRGRRAWETLSETSALELLDAADVEPDEALRQMVVCAIHRDHERQLADNLLAGFVKRLDQQFPRAELYLFELLQNAVDEGAQRVSFEMRDGSLVFQHDGEAFNASDILGLSAVGASGKTGRTIGFMGLGFKAVYSRFDRVVLSGGGWAVKYERPGETREGGWKFLPDWYPDAPAPDSGFTCRFDFGRPRGSPNAVIDDLAKLDDVVPVLLARRALRAEGATWSLNWNGRRIRVERDLDGPAGVERLILTDGAQERRWLFLGTKWCPSEDAIGAWRDFRDDPDGDPGEQELSLFAELDGDDNLVDQKRPGVLHAVLPTAEELPLGFNLQANWLLRADRQGAMSARDNAWNADIVSQLPSLVIRLLHWIADGDGPPSVEDPYRRLPILKLAGGRPSLSILDIEVDFSAVVEALLTEDLVPSLDVKDNEAAGDDRLDESEGSAAQDRGHARRAFARPSSCNYEFVSAKRCRRIPDALLSGLSPRFVNSWLGGLAPFAFGSDDRAGDFFRSAAAVNEVSDEEWEASAANYEAAFRSLPSERVRAWASIHVAAAVFRARNQGEALPDGLAMVPNGDWRPCDAEELEPPPRQYLFLDEAAREILAPDPAETPAIPLLQALVAPTSGHRVDDGNARVVADEFWPKGGEERRLREITEPFFVREVADQAGWIAEPAEHVRRVVAVTAAIRRLGQGHDAVTHILASESGTTLLRPKLAVWVGAAYGSPQVEAAAGGRVPLVSSDYGDDVEWRSFFASACRTRPETTWGIATTLSAYNHAEIRDWLDAAPSVARQNVYLALPMGLGNGHRDQVHAICTSLRPWPEILQDTEFDLVRARSFAAVIAQGRYSPTIANGRSFSPLTVYATWVADKNNRGYAPTAKRVPAWIATLRDRPWVPTDGGKVVAPRDVLLLADPHNAGAPVADLDDATRAGLAPLVDVLKFGAAVPRPGPLAVLVRAAEKPETTDEVLAALWLDVIRDDKLDVAVLREKARVIDMLPVKVARRDGKRRVASSRLVKAGNADFGGFLCALADTLLGDHAARLGELLVVPERPTATQAATYLEWVWSNEPPDVEDAVVTAWRAVAAEPAVWPAIRASRDAGAMKLFCRQPTARRGEWLRLPSVSPREPVWNDAPVKAACLRPTDGLWPEAWLARRAADLDVDAVLALSGLGRLSDERFLLAVNRSGDEEMPSETSRLRKVLAAIRAIHEGESLPPGNLLMRRAHSIERTFRVGDGPARVEQLDASWDGERTMHVVGRKSAAWATDLRPLVQQALGLGGNARALRLLDLIPLLDDEENFERKLDQICTELDVPGDAFQADTSTRPHHDEDAPVDDHYDGDDEEGSDEDEDEDDGASEPAGVEPEGPHPDDGKTNPTNRNPTGGGGGGGGGSGSNQNKGSGSSKRPPGGSWDPGIAPNRFLIDHTEADERDATDERERQLPKDDAAARETVMKFERRWGRTPSEADRYQRGYDVSSQDGASVRKIEIKGLQGAWQGQASVSMTGAQFDDARQQEGEWWLYVVEYAGSDRANVIALRNPAKGARSFYLYACHWRSKAVTPPTKRLQTPDDDEGEI